MLVQPWSAVKSLGRPALEAAWRNLTAPKNDNVAAISAWSFELEFQLLYPPTATLPSSCKDCGATRASTSDAIEPSAAAST